MAEDNREMLKRLRDTFREEAADRTAALSSGLLELERAASEPDKARLLEQVFREAHSFKGAARAVEARDAESLCQALESVFASLRGGAIPLSRPLFDLLHKAVDLAGEVSIPSQAPSASAFVSDPGGTAAMVSQLMTAAAMGSAASPADVPPAHAVPAPAAEDTVRIATAKLNALLYQVEDLFPVKLAADQLAAELREFRGQAAGWKKAWIRANQDLRGLHSAARDATAEAERRRHLALTRLQGFLDWNELFLESLEARLKSLHGTARRNQVALRTVADGLLHEVKKALTLPVRDILAGFPKIVRDLSRDQGKEIDFSLHGAEAEIDKRILQELKDVLIHLVRNCVDHGIERPEIRLGRGKPAQGKIAIVVAQTGGGRIEISVSDDGTGIDAEALLAAAVRQGALPQKEASSLGQSAVLRLALRSGISTSPAPTDLSGRGLGLAIVREKIESLEGTVSLHSQPGAGTVIRMSLPVSLTSFRGLVIEEGKRLFAIPTAYVWKAVRFRESDVKSLENREAVFVDGQALALVRLGDILGLPRREAEGSAAGGAGSRSPAGPVRPFSLAVLSADGRRIAFRVDAIQGEQELMAKGLGPQLARVRNIGGAAISAFGRIIPVLNVPDLIRSSLVPAERPRAAEAPKPPRARKAVLVVEDSITSRTLLKNILEAAGYIVDTAVDGLDALSKLAAGKFDAVISDVDMPRLNGFDLTTRIRSVPRIASTPVVLITSLESREDQERGFAVGAQAYIVKSRFEQGNLLETLARLV